MHVSGARLFLYGVILLLVSCNGKKQTTSASGTVKAFPVIVLQPTPAKVYTDYPATVQGIQNVEIRPKIDGYVEGIYVDEGATVRKGQLLFRINAPQYEQDVRTAEANIKIAAADVNAAQMQVNKVEPLVKQDIISKFELESALYTLEAKKAALAQAQAALNNAEINLSYTTIYSPVDGVIGILPNKIGSLISSTTTNPLTTVSDIRSIYAYYSINEKQGLDFFASSRKGTMQQKLLSLPPVQLVLANGSVFPLEGKVETASGLINAQTGSVNMRATFPNPDGLIRSGSSAVVRMSQQIDTALLIPQKATYQIQGKLFAYVVDTADKVSSVEVTTGSSYLDYYVVTGGLKKSDRVVADGIGNLREGMLIKPQPYTGTVQAKGN